MPLWAETDSLKPAHLAQGVSYGEIPFCSPGNGSLQILAKVEGAWGRDSLAWTL